MTTYPLALDDETLAISLPLLDAACGVLVDLSPQLAYNDSNKHTHRVLKARKCYLDGSVFLTKVTGVYRVKSSNAPKARPRYHWVHLTQNECSCEDFQRTGACYHLFAVAFAKNNLVPSVAVVMYAEQEVCPGCDTPMLYQERFWDYYARDEDGGYVQQWLGAYVCGACGYAIRDDGREECLCEGSYKCGVHQKTPKMKRVKRNV